jgi:hypothetical protein
MDESVPEEVKAVTAHLKNNAKWLSTLEERVIDQLERKVQAYQREASWRRYIDGAFILLIVAGFAVVFIQSARVG